MSKSELPEPLIPAHVDLRAYPFVPLYRAQLWGSEFHAEAVAEEWRAGVILWLKSWDQVPAGTLPEKEALLAKLAEVDLPTWNRVKLMALHGWVLCSDGRLHHPVVADYVLKAWQSHRRNVKKGLDGAAKRWGNKKKPGNSRSNGPAIAGLWPNYSNRDGDRDGDGEKKEEAAVPVPSEREGLNSGGAKAPSSNPSDWLWAEGLKWLVETSKRPEKSVRPFIGKCRAALKNDDAKLRTILESAMAQMPADPLPWITAAIKARQASDPAPVDDPLTEDDHQLVRLFGAVATDVLNFKLSGSWFNFMGPKPDDPACHIEPVVLSRHGFADPAIYQNWHARLNGAGR